MCSPLDWGCQHLISLVWLEEVQPNLIHVHAADVNLLKVPEGMDDKKVVLLSDILPTGWHGACLANVEKGSRVAIWGCGPGVRSRLACMCRAGRKLQCTHQMHKSKVIWRHRQGCLTQRMISCMSCETSGAYRQRLTRAAGRAKALFAAQEHHVGGSMCLLQPSKHVMSVAQTICDQAVLWHLEGTATGAPAIGRASTLCQGVFGSWSRTGRLCRAQGRLSSLTASPVAPAAPTHTADANLS